MNTKIKISKTYDQDFKEKLIKEFQETKSLSVVSRKNNVPVSTLRQWIINKDPVRIAGKKEKKAQSKLEKDFHELQMENEILKELLKKTNQAWLKD